jgi:hypothetical protein
VVPRRARDVRSGALAGAALVLFALLLAGCGGGTRQDSGEPEGTFHIQLVHASFPALQVIARPVFLALAFRNTGTTTVPNLAVTVDSLEYASNFPELASDKRPIWAIERGPGPVARPPVPTQEVSSLGGGQTAYVKTWALGPLEPGKIRTFIWKLAPVKSGLHVVHFVAAAGLSGKALARTPAGHPVSGAVIVHIRAAPPPKHVNPNTGEVEVGAAPPPSNP